jgi:transmembrane sensor
MNRFDRLGESIAREQDVWLEQNSAHDEVRTRLATLELPPSAAPARALQRWLWTASGAGALAACAVALLWWHAPRHEEPALAVHIASTHALVPAGGFVEAPSTDVVAMNFSDGSRIELAEQSRARVVELKPTGADVLLESGLLHVQVHHREHSAWHIGAGPFGVRVTGTRFDVRWQPEDDAFELTLREGRVTVTGCVFGEGYRMQAGQTVRASCRKEHFNVSSDNGSSSIVPANGATQPAAVNGATPSAAQAPSLPPRAASEVVHATDTEPNHAAHAAIEPHRAADWHSLARAGRFAEALGSVKALGFAALVQHASAEQLSLLADVAHYGHDGANEARALRSLRARFHGTKRAALAAFALGRLEFDNYGAYAEAAEWFRVYLKEQPKGELAREALGRLLEATQRGGRMFVARELATSYLRDYPDGPHAELARSLTEPAETQAR